MRPEELSGQLREGRRCLLAAGCTFASAPLVMPEVRVAVKEVLRRAGR